MIFERIGDFVLRRRLFTAVALVLAFVGMFSGVHKVVVDFSATAFFAGDAEDRENLDRYRDFWGTDDKLAVVLVDGGEETLLTKSRVDQLKALTEAVREIEATEQVSSITDVPRFRVQF